MFLAKSSGDEQCASGLQCPSQKARSSQQPTCEPANDSQVTWDARQGQHTADDLRRTFGAHGALA
jgi:hypothetical protein